MAHAMAFVQSSWTTQATFSHRTKSFFSQARKAHVWHPKVGCRRSRRTQVTSSYSEDLPVVKEKLNEKKKKNQELNLPLQPNKERKTTPTSTSSSSFEMKEALKAAKEKYGEETVTKNLKEAKKKFGKQGVGKLMLFGGAATLGLFLSGAVLTSLEVLPLVPEAMQAVGLAYSILVASRVIQGKNQTFTMSPVKAVLEIIDVGKKSQKERTSLVLPEDLEEGVVVAMERLAMERDTAVNQVQQMKMQTSEVSRILAEKEELKLQKSEYSRILAEKEALETVALQLAEERQTAMAEVNALKSSVEMMTDRMKGIEEMLVREVGQLKTQNHALETVALQLAQERDVAYQEVASLQESIKKSKSDAEKQQALEEVAVQLAQERDSALFELESLKKFVANIRNIETADKDHVVQTHVIDIRSQVLDGHASSQDVSNLVTQPPFGP